MKVTLAHGSGGQSTKELIEKIFAASYSNDVLDMMEDSAVVGGCGKIAITTDSFVVNPLFFRGGDIGRLAVCGTVNDLLMRGATPKYLTSAFIIEEGAEIDELKSIATSMANAAKEAGIIIVAGDTKVIDGNGGIYINTSGVLWNFPVLLLGVALFRAPSVKAMKKDTGARALRSIIEEFMLDIMYEIPKDDNIGIVTITKEYVEGTGAPMITMRGQAKLPVNN